MTQDQSPMLAGQVSFTWWRLLDANFECATASEDPSLFLGAVVRWVSYEPLRQYPALFREFADLGCTAGAVAEFIAEYGPLRVDPDTRATDGHFETLGEWRDEIETMRLALRLWDALSTGRASDVVGEIATLPIVGHTLNNFPVDEFHRWLARSDARRSLSAVALTIPMTERFPRQTVFLGKSDDVLGFAYGTATSREVVQAVLAGLISRQLGARGVNPDVQAFDRPYGVGLRVTFDAPNLIAALWLQLALAVDGNRKYLPCPECGKWWDATDARSHKKVCSAKCRAAKSYRVRTTTKRAAENEGADDEL